MRSPARPATTARLRWPDRQHALLQHHRGRSRCSSVGRDIVPILALAGSMAAKRRVAPSLGTFPTTGRCGRPADRRHDHRRRADLLPRPRRWARSSSSCSRTPEGVLTTSSRSLLRRPRRGTRRFQRFVTLGGAKPSRPAAPAARHPRLRAAALGAAQRRPQARPPTADPQPGDVRRRDHGGAGDADLARNVDRPPADDRRRRPRLPAPDRGLAVVHGPLRDLRRGRRRGPRPRPGRDAAQDPVRDDRPAPPPTGRSRPSARPSSARAT